MERVAGPKYTKDKKRERERVEKGEGELLTRGNA